MEVPLLRSHPALVAGLLVPRHVPGEGGEAQRDMHRGLSAHHHLGGSRVVACKKQQSCRVARSSFWIYAWSRVECRGGRV